MPLQFKTDEELIAFVIKQKLPDWQAKLFKKNAEAIQVHSQGQIFYKVDRLFPNEQKESKAHRILSFESITEPSFGRAANNINRIFKNSSYTFEASETTIKVSNAHTFEDQNLFSWFLDKWVSWALKEDPNSLIAVYPPEYTKAGNEQVVFIPSSNILYVDEDAVIFISENESEKTYDTEDVKISSEVFYDQEVNRMNVRRAHENTFTPKIVAKITRPAYHVFLKGVGFYKIKKNNSEKEYDLEFYKIKQPFLPATDSGGEKNIYGINKSFLHPFVSFGNLALLQHSQHTAVNFTFSFPRMSEIQTPCDHPNCLSGKVSCETSTENPDGTKACIKCGGTGYLSNQTPYKIYRKVYDPQGMEGDSRALEAPDVQFYTPDVSILDYSKREWKEYLEMAEKAVYVTQKIMTGNVEASKSKEIDRDDLYSFLSRVAQCYFSKLRFVLQAIENYNVPNPTKVSVQIPYSYAILSEGEAFVALRDILVSSVPVMLKASQVESFINKFVSQSSPIRKFIDVLKIVDPLLYYSSTEISSFKMNMIVTPEQYSNHVFSFPVLQKLYFEDKNLFIQDTSEIIKKVEEELLAYVPETPDLKTAIISKSA